jgi:hypothetical protein
MSTCRRPPPCTYLELIGPAEERRRQNLPKDQDHGHREEDGHVGRDWERVREGKGAGRETEGESGLGRSSLPTPGLAPLSPYPVGREREVASH